MDGIGKKIKELRKREKISQEKLALEINVSRQTLSSWETDKIQPTLDNVLAICKFFNIPPQSLVADYEPAIAENEQAISESYNEISTLNALPEYTGIITYISSECGLSEEKAPNKRKKVIVWTMIIVGFLIIGSILGFVAYLFMPMAGASETVSNSSWNFDDKSVLYGIIAGIVALILLIITVCLVIRHIRNKKH